LVSLVHVVSSPFHRFSCSFVGFIPSVRSGRQVSLFRGVDHLFLTNKSANILIF